VYEIYLHVWGFEAEVQGVHCGILLIGGAGTQCAYTKPGQEGEMDVIK
jgi:hypothetical protein